MIPYEGRRAVYEAAIDKFGQDLQIWKAVEEMAELTKELAKHQGGNYDSRSRDRLVDEIADVTIMVEQLRIIFGVNVSVQDRMDFKVCRLADRVGMSFIPEAREAFNV